MPTNHTKYMQDWRKKNLEKARSIDRKSKLKRKEQKAEYDKAYNAANRDKKRAQSKEWYESHKEQHQAINRKNAPKYIDKQKAAARQWRESNREREKANAAKWRELNREHIRERARARYQSDHDYHLAKNRRRRDAVRGAKVCDFTAQQWKFIKDTYSHRCAYCGIHSERLTMDHVLPISKGGNHTQSNIVPACRKCNYAKSNKTDWHPNPPYSGVTYR